MNRKWIVAIATMFSFSALVAGLSIAMADDEGPVHDVMEKINSKSNAIKKAIRAEPGYKKAKKELPTLVKDLVQLSKDTKELAKDAVKKAKNVKDAEQQWADLSDALTKELEKFDAKVNDSKSEYKDIKSAYGPVSQSCTKCHDVFRVEENGF
ncbi:cytochrome c [Singulisphaera acidiphila]|uniref:Cytochrome C n=1 Tax=Singulisphaera acidiphila (strain ATCC BAA-1392 / DSM 18658 / VKM B-2454 / MOB10) TaxID=886293 RepID=L0DP28_SINAD|nr:cytochrome c [Singulisphaera acidiphila]AGA30608.1 Cytochrome C'' [Singulisphaera acidiphila DSM 18658]